MHHILDGLNEQRSNWMRYVNPARTVKEQNLVACQNGLEIYFYTIKPLQPGQELLVWYCQELAQRCNYPPLGQLSMDSSGKDGCAFTSIKRKLQMGVSGQLRGGASIEPTLGDVSCVAASSESKSRLTDTVFVRVFKTRLSHTHSSIVKEKHNGGQKSPESRAALSPGKMRPISGLGAVFRFLFLISSLKQAFLFHSQTQRACMPAERPHALTRICQC